MLEGVFGFKALAIAADRCHRQCLAAAKIADRTVPRVETAINVCLIPSFGMSHIGNRKIILFGPEEGDGVEPFMGAENIARGGLPLPLGDHEMFDANGFAGEPVGPARDVARRENAG